MVTNANPDSAADFPPNRKAESEAVDLNQRRCFHAGERQRSSQPIALVLVALGVLLGACSSPTHPPISDHHSAVAGLFVKEIEQDTLSLVRQITLSTTTDSQRQQLVSIQEQFFAGKSLLDRQPGSKSLNNLLRALDLLLLQNSPALAIPILEEVESSQAPPATESMTLVLLGIAHYLKDGQEQGGQAYSPVAESYFQRAQDHPFELGLASNGLAVQAALKAFQHLGKGETDAALGLLRKAEQGFAKASDIDGTTISSYRYFNNVTYIRETLLARFLDGSLEETKLLAHYNEPSVESFIESTDQTLDQANRLARGGAGSQEKAAAECLSITGEYFERQGQLDEANRRYSLSKKMYLAAIDKGLLEGLERDEIMRSLQRGRLLRAIVATEGTLDELLARATE
ncbi:MAG: hypothetical protein K0U98_16370 [Deltaproteobacteria bacterium]|nr:hypothetical protein [Deltaproteobacteria bacterium]